MDKLVWRFPLVPEDQSEDGATCDVTMPAGAQILGVQNSSRGLILHAIVDPGAEDEERSFFVCGNNVPLPQDAGAATYRGTYKQPGGVTAHVFEIVKVPA